MRVSASLLSDRLRQHTADTRAQSATISALGGFTLLLAGLGLYALVAQLVAERTRELGIRAALAAAPARLVSLVVRSVGASVLAGLGAGVLVATLAVRLLSRFLFETGPFDPLAWTGAVLVLLAVGSTAVFVPARRAARLDPAVVLRD